MRCGQASRDTVACAFSLNRPIWRLVPILKRGNSNAGDAAASHYPVDLLDKGSAMLSSDLPSASMPNLSSVTAAMSKSNAANPYPKLTRQVDPDSISHPNSNGEVPP